MSHRNRFVVRPSDDGARTWDIFDRLTGQAFRQCVERREVARREARELNEQEIAIAKTLERIDLPHVRTAPSLMEMDLAVSAGDAEWVGVEAKTLRLTARGIVRMNRRYATKKEVT